MSAFPGELPAACLEKVRDACAGRVVAGALVLGSGLGRLLEVWPLLESLAGATLPGYPTSTVPGHASRVAVVRWGERAGLVFQGRVHFYEGYGRGDVTFAVRLAAALGADWVLLTNAAGAIDARLTPGTVMVVEDHLRLNLGGRIARGAAPGPTLRGAPYHPQRTEQLFRILAREGLRVVRGVLAGCLGPSYETAAEVEMARRLGTQAACMSTVIEAEEASRQGMEVAAVSLVTNLATGLAGGRLDHAEVVAMAAEVGPRLAQGLAAVVGEWTAN